MTDIEKLRHDAELEVFTDIYASMLANLIIAEQFKGRSNEEIKAALAFGLNGAAEIAHIPADEFEAFKILLLQKLDANMDGVRARIYEPKNPTLH